MPSPSTRIGLVAALALVAGLIGCRDDREAGSTDAFCAQVDEHQATLFQPLADLSRTSLEAMVDLYREVGEVAPLAVEENWSAIAGVFETALSSDDLEAVYTEAYSSQPAAIAVAEWVQQNCAITIPLATVAPLDAPLGATTTTTLAP